MSKDLIDAETQRKESNEKLGKAVKYAGGALLTGVTALGLSAGLGEVGEVIDGQKSLPNNSPEKTFEIFLKQKYATDGPNGTFSNEQARAAFELHMAQKAADNPQMISDEEKTAFAKSKVKAEDTTALANIAEQESLAKEARSKEQAAWAKQQQDVELAIYFSAKEKAAAQHAKAVDDTNLFNEAHNNFEIGGRVAGAAVPLTLGGAAGIYSLIETRRRERATDRENGGVQAVVAGRG